MNVSKFIIGSVVVFIVMTGLEFLFHAWFMAETYAEHAELVRNEADSGSLMWAMMLGFLIMSFGFCFIFTKGYQGKGCLEGIRYGLYIGVTFGVAGNLINYAVFPWPGNWVFAWIVYYPILMMILGAIFAAIYKPAPAK